MPTVQEAANKPTTQIKCNYNLATNLRETYNSVWSTFSYHFSILTELPKSTLEECEGCVDAVASMSAGEPVREDDLILIGELPDDTTATGQFYSVLREEMLNLIGDPVLSLIELRDEDKEAGMKFSTLFAAAQYKNNPKVRTYRLHN